MTTSIGGRYRLEDPIGRGASGQVWRAHDTTLGRTVAMKRLGTLPGLDDEDRRRSAREAHLAARLNHPHIVAVFDLVSEDDADWLVMEYVEGRDLAALVREHGPMAPAEAARLLAQIADALAAAHADGIVHRDVKPSNILVRHDGSALLSDFGIARGASDPSLTRTGLVTGSPAYLAPEVASGATASAASDVWSWGATLLHVLTGRSPFAAGTAPASDSEGQHVLGTLYRIVHEPPPRLPGAGWPADLLEVTLVHDLDERWDMARVHAALLGGHAEIVAPPVERTARRTPAVAPSAAEAPEATSVLPATTQAPIVPPPPATGADGVRVAPAPAGASGRRRPAALIAALVVLALLAGGGLWALLDGDPSRDRTPTAASSAGSGGSGASSATPSAEEMAAFARTYVRTAAADPEAGFRLLTPAYQNASGGLPGYTSFWGSVVRVRSMQDVRADPEDLTVTYRYQYVLRRGGARTEDVSLRLEYRRDGSFRISGAA